MYLDLLHDTQQRRLRLSDPRLMNPHLRNEDEKQIEAFTLNQLKMVTEQRASFQTVARQLHADVDELLGQLEKEAVSGKPDMLILARNLDFNGYHGRRDGFDARKYCNR